MRPPPTTRTTTTAAASTPTPSSSSSATNHNNGYQKNTLNLSKTDVIDELAKLGYARDALPEQVLDAFIEEMKEQYRAELSEFLTEEEADDDEEELDEDGQRKEELLYEEEREEQDEYISSSQRRQRRAWSLAEEEQEYAGTPTTGGAAAAAAGGHAQRVKWRDGNDNGDNNDDEKTAAAAAANSGAAAGASPPPSSSSATYRMSIIERLAALDLSRVRETVARQHRTKVRPLDDDDDDDDRSEEEADDYTERTEHSALQMDDDDDEEEEMVAGKRPRTFRYDNDDLREASEGFILTMKSLQPPARKPDRHRPRRWANGDVAEPVYFRYTHDGEESYSEIVDDSNDDDDDDDYAPSASSLGPAEAATAARTYNGRPKLYTGFIYPSFSNATTRARKKKHDPVARFHAHRQRWEQDPFLRRMAHPSQQRPPPLLLPPAADFYHHHPLVLPPPPPPQQSAQRPRHDLAAMRSGYVVPTEKKRAHLVWETRNVLNDMRGR
ncbi:hypothetical protein HDU87_001179 [Geranomyces variabilis]|uniref:Uncharacterized protein n=1 Tax=Geranomyces variabilis TaxID=109894 RepID=A0AAD5TBC3_9FUNG|nr:hypothetical protein HDU87_001179 [Geranomyces variabilis]